MTQNESLFALCGICCIYPIFAGVISIILYKRYEHGGWRYVIFGKAIDK